MAIQRSDTVIKGDILAELKWNPQVKETDIGVIVKDGAVTLTGNVSSYAQKSAAHDVVKGIKGVRAIDDDIKVKLAYELEGTDKDIAERISRMYRWNTQIPDDSVKAEVSNGLVTLSGEVDWNYQRDAAQQLIKGINGVEFIYNNIKIRKHASTPNVKSEIVKALHRHAGVEADRVNVTAVGGTVTLSGSVSTYLEKDLVDSAAWSASGVDKVVNNINVAPDYSDYF